MSGLALAYNGTPIRTVGERLNLTDMWRASGADLSRQPAEWLRSADAARFVGFLAETLNMGNSQDGLVKVVRGGKDPHTSSHWQIGLAYAKYLSPEFHMWCNTVVRERMEGRSAADLLSREDREIIGGIIKAVIHKELTAEIPAMVAQALTADPRLAAVTDVSQRQLLDKAKVPSKGRNPLNRKFSYHLPRFAIVHKVLPKECAHSGVLLYPVDLAERFLFEHGNRFIADHMAKIQGQGVFSFAAAKARKDQQPTTD